MSKSCEQYQIPEYETLDEVVWRVENIRVTFYKSTGRWIYELLIFDYDLDDWTCERITKVRARELCDVEFPDKFYS